MPVLLERLDLRGVPAAELADVGPRPRAEESFPTEAVRGVLDEVREGGDKAVRALTARFDGGDIDALRVPPAEPDPALPALDPALRVALDVAYERILAYHRHEPDPVADFVDGGVLVRHLVRAVARAGLYAPGGGAGVPSP